MQIDVEATLSSLDISSFVGRSVSVLGITGSGKTNTAAVLIEELLTGGLPLTIVDIEGEYWGLKEKFEILVAGRSEHSELVIEPWNAGHLAQLSLGRGISVILDLSEYTQEESLDLLLSYFSSLWEVAGKERKPYSIVLEEAHEWLPQSVRFPLKSVLTRIALRGRKRGLGIILMSQRSAKVEKDVLTQTSMLFLHKVIHPTDMKVYKDLIPLSPSDVEQMVGGLCSGRAIVVIDHTPQVVQIRWRRTLHVGATPGFGAADQVDIRLIDADLLRELQQALSSVPRSDQNVNSELTSLKKRVVELEALLAQRDGTIEQQAEQIGLLSKLQVEGPSVLEVNQAIIRNMNAVVSQVGSREVVESEPVKALSQSLDESRLRSLQQRLGKLSARQRQIFKLLIERGDSMTLVAIADYLNCSRETVRINMLPDSFFRMGMIHRSVCDRSYVYVSIFRHYLSKEFPGMDYEYLLQRLGLVQ